jgi:uncharacterized protein (TIGR00255 family)
MTGMGRAERLMRNHGRVWAELRSVNHKYLEALIRMPYLFTCYEPEVRALIKSRIARGSIQVSLGWDSEPVSSALELNYELCRDYLELGEYLKERFGLPGRLEINTLLQFPGVVTASRSQKDIVRAWQGMRRLLAQALDRMLRMRAQEGRILARDMMRSVHRVLKSLDAIDRHSPAQWKRRRKEILNLLQEAVGADPKKLLAVANAQLDRFDITEELVRLRSHSNLFLETLRLSRPIGRRLDFIAQEMLREANTISAKASDGFIAQRVVRIKEEIEYLREQAQNVE